MGDCLAATTLGPGQNLTGTLIFHLPAPVPGLQLVWVTVYRELRLALGVASAGPLPTGGGARR